MTKLMLILAALSLSACASMQSKWAKVGGGDNTTQVREKMGPPGYSGENEGLIVWGWDMGDFEWCYIRFREDKTVKDNRCQVDYAARQAYGQAMMGMLQQQQRMNTYQPVQGYQMPVQQTTRCQTRWVGETAYTDCNGY